MTDFQKLLFLTFSLWPLEALAVQAAWTRLAPLFRRASQDWPLARVVKLGHTKSEPEAQLEEDDDDNYLRGVMLW